MFIGLTTYSLNAQNYTNGIGLRGGFGNGITFKHFLGGAAAVEGILTSRSDKNGFGLTGLYEIHNSPFSDSRWEWYYGAGAHIGTFAEDASSYMGIGVDGIIGIEFAFAKAPFHISLDWKPYVNLIGLNKSFATDGGALSIRYNW